MTRRLAAIVVADVVGYSALMAEDETSTLEALRRLRAEVLGPVVSGQGGEIVKSMGDGWIVSFSSAATAVNAAMLIQDQLAMHPAMKLRIGVHIGDVTRDVDDIFGDAVNVAARLKSVARPGEIYVSDSTFYSLDGTLSPSFDDRGERELKNIGRPVRVFVRTAPKPVADAGAGKAGFPQLAIVPISTTDPRDALIEMTEVMTSDAATYLGSVSWLRASVIETPAPESYVLRTSLRARGDRLRLEARLVGPDGNDVWISKLDGTLADSFDWQDQSIEEISSAVYAAIIETETKRLRSAEAPEYSAEECLLMGVMAWREVSVEASLDALGFFQRAIEAEPDMAAAYAEAIMVTISMQTVGYSKELADYVARMPEWLAAARKMAGQMPMLDMAIAIAGYLEDRDSARLNVEIESIMRRVPFDFRVLTFAGWSCLWSGMTERALECFEKSIRLGKLNPVAAGTFNGAANASVQLGRDEQGLAYAMRALKISSTYPAPYCTAAVANAYLGNQEEAERLMGEHKKLVPRQTITSRRAFNDYGGSPGGERYLNGLKMAGMPE